MKLTTNIKYWEGYLPTPRSRKERFRSIEETIQVEILEFSKNDLRPAFIIHDPPLQDGDQVIYLCGDELYTEAFASNFTAKPEGMTALEGLTRCLAKRTFDTDKTDRNKAIAKAEGYVCIFMVADGVLYRKCNEPLYTIHTFGAGRNHGGTSLSVANHGPEDFEVRYCYSALDAELAVKEAKEVALGRGDTDYVQYITADIEVLLPEACKFPRRITDPLAAIQAELAQGNPVEIFNTDHRFRVVSAEVWDPQSVNPQILVTLNCGLRIRLPRKTDGRCSRSWFINRSEKGVLQIEINWGFLDLNYLNI